MEQRLGAYEHTQTTLTINVVDASGSAVDLTTMSGITFFVHKLSADDGTNLFTKELGAGITAPTPTNGQILVVLDAADVVIDETTENQVQAIWQVRYTDGSTITEFTREEPFDVFRNRCVAG